MLLWAMQIFRRNDFKAFVVFLSSFAAICFAVHVIRGAFAYRHKTYQLGQAAYIIANCSRATSFFREVEKTARSLLTSLIAYQISLRRR
jgi:hypothetical protein